MYASRGARVAAPSTRLAQTAAPAAFLGVVVGVASGVACSYEQESDRPRVQKALENVTIHLSSFEKCSSDCFDVAPKPFSGMSAVFFSQPDRQLKANSQIEI